MRFPVYGQGNAWSPASLTVFIGDTVMWRWEAPAFQEVGYRVFSVSSPSGTSYEGGPFTSGETKTAQGRTRVSCAQIYEKLFPSLSPITKQSTITSVCDFVN